MSPILYFFWEMFGFKPRELSFWIQYRLWTMAASAFFEVVKKDAWMIRRYMSWYGLAKVLVPVLRNRNYSVWFRFRLRIYTIKSGFYQEKNDIVNFWSERYVSWDGILGYHFDKRQSLLLADIKENHLYSCFKNTYKKSAKQEKFSLFMISIL